MHLLITPLEAGALPRLMHTFARNYACRFNARHGRTGTLWECRYKACVVDSSRHFLACCRYIELNPVRAWMVARPGDYAWSGWRGHVGERVEPFLTPHAKYLALGPNPAARAKAYRALFAEAVLADLLDEIRRYLAQERALGSDRFRAWVASRTGRFSAVRASGRPPRTGNCP